ncbi:MBG domain-containing protein, partial [Acetobacterium tundrae]
NPNYADSAAVETTLTITPAEVTITVDPQTKVYGESDPALTGKQTGLVKDSDLGTISYSRIAADTGKETVGADISITATYTANTNYTVNVTNSKLVITKAESNTVNITGFTGTYDGQAHGLSAVSAGIEGSTIWYGNDESGWSSNPPVFTEAGTYQVSVMVTNPNYYDVFGTGTVTIQKKAVTITADDKTKVYGQSDPILTATIDGLIGTDTLNYNLSRDPGEAVGTYAIRVNFEQMNVYSDSEVSTEAYRDINSNYDVTAVNGILTITPSVVVNYYDINYLAGAEGVTNMPSSQTNIVAGSQQTVSTQIPVRSGYTFEGWNVSGATAVDGQFTMPGNTVNITANWKANQYDLNITY